MKRVYFSVLGLLMLGGLAWLLVSFGLSDLEGALVIQVTGFALAGLLWVAGGLLPADRTISGLSWYHFVGLGTVVLGLSQFVAGTERVTTTDGPTFVAVMIALGGLVLAFIGVDYLRGGVHFDLSRVA